MSTGEPNSLIWFSPSWLFRSCSRRYSLPMRRSARWEGFFFSQRRLVMIVFSLLLAASSRSIGSPSPVIERFISLERSVHVLEIGLLLVLFLVCRVLGIVWQRFAFGIAVGLGLTLSGEAIAAALRAFLGAAGNHLYIWLEPLSATLATCVWAYYSISVDRKAEALVASPSPSQLMEWNRALGDFLSRS